MMDFVLQKINLQDKAQRHEVFRFLECYGLSLDDDVDYTLILRNAKGELKATCSKAGNIFKCFAVSEELQGENITSVLITALLDQSYEEQIFHNLMLTRPCHVPKFAALNFKLVCKTEQAALMEHGIYTIEQAMDHMAERNQLDSSTPKGALVMNCNPFTTGHRYLVESAAAVCSQVLLFVVEENQSLFSFDQRFRIVKEAVKDLGHVKVIPGGEYIISSATFPSYFLRQEDEWLKAYTEMDSSIFGQYFCNRFHITKRFVGQEPICPITNAYNATLKEVLPRYGVEVVEIERKRFAGDWISASQVRTWIREHNLAAVQQIVPDATWEFLISPEGKECVERIQQSCSPH